MRATFKSLLAGAIAALVLKATGCSSTQQPQPLPSISPSPQRPETYAERKTRKARELREKVRKINTRFASQQKKNTVEFNKTRTCLHQRKVQQSSGQLISKECQKQLEPIEKKLVEDYSKISAQRRLKPNPTSSNLQFSTAQNPSLPQPTTVQKTTSVAFAIQTPLPQPAAVTQPTPKVETASNLKFPQVSCGDKIADSDSSWYPVFINGGNLEEIRSNYCRDAFSTTRQKTGQPAVQLASFTDYQKALEFAKAVGGEVGRVGSRG